MKSIEQVKTKLKSLEEKLPLAHSGIVIVDESKGESYDKLPESIKAIPDLVILIDDIV